MIAERRSVKWTLRNAGSGIAVYRRRQYVCEIWKGKEFTQTEREQQKV